MDRSILIRLGLDPDRFNRGLASASTHAKVFVKDLDSADSRMTNLVQTSLALGPALVPIGAAGAGAIAGLATSLAAAATGAGVAVFAFQGVGDSLKALNDYYVDPTQEHLDKLRETLDELGPAGQEFVLFLQNARPEIERLQAMAQAGLLPGVEDGLSELLDMMPQVEDLITSLSTAMGDAAAQGGDALNSPFWIDFIDFMATDGRDALTTMLDIIGHLTKAGAGLLQAFDPLSDDVGAGLLARSEELAGWADKLDETQGFQDFLAYVEDVGPDVWQTLGALGNALVSVAQAAAPVGAVSLPILEALADIISTIADSPVGPVLVGAAAGMSAFSRAVALYKVANGTAISNLLFGGASKGSHAASEGLLGSGKGAALRGTAAAIGVLALSLTDLDEASGLSNTLNFAALGGIAGPWGAGIGAVIGQVKDFAAANDELEDSIRSVNAALEDPTGFEAQDRAIQQLRDQADKLHDERYSLSLGDFTPSGIVENFKAAAGNGLDQQALDAMSKAIETQDRYKESLSDLGNEMRGNTVFEDFTGDTSKLTQFATDAEPVLEKMGLTIQDVVNIRTIGSGSGQFIWDDFIASFNRTADQMDSLPGRVSLVKDAFAGLDDQIGSTADDAEALRVALDALLSPQMDLEAATDAYTTALRHMQDDLAPTFKVLEDGTKVTLDNSRQLTGNSDAAIQNRAAIRERVTALTDMLVAEAEVHPNAARLSEILQTQRSRLIESADAAGLNKDEVRDLIKQYGLVPRLVKTLIEANTEPAMRSARQLKAYIENLDPTMTIRQKVVETRLGIPTPAAGGWMSDYADAYGYAQGGWAGFRRRTGLIDGPGSTTSDDIPAMVSRKEFITRAVAVDKAGVDAMYTINSGGFDRDRLRASLGLAAGGMAGFDPSHAFRVSAPPVVHVSGGGQSLDGATLTLDMGWMGKVEARVSQIARQEVDDHDAYKGSRVRR